MRLIMPVFLVLACARCEIGQMPGVSTGVLAAAALIGGGAATTDGDILEGLGLSALGAALAVGSFSALGGEIADLDLEDQRPEIRTALARGGGVFVSDLAAALRLPARDVPCLGRALQAARPELTKSMANPLRGQHALAFVDALRRVLQAEPVLANTLEKRRREIENAFRARAAATTPP